MESPCIVFEKVSKTFDMRLLYKKVDFSLYPSDIVLVTGNNGTGKSTLLRMALDLCRPTEGKITCHVPPKECAYLGHATFIYPQLTAFENLVFWTNAVRDTKVLEEEILAMLKRVNLEKFAHDPAHIFSRGMSQRLNIARILLQEPKLLFLDEPCTGLDGDSKAIFYEAIQDFAQKQTCILWVSHDAVADSPYATHRMHIAQKRIELQSLKDTQGLDISSINIEDNHA